LKQRAAWKTYAFWILLTEALGAAVGFLTRKGMEQYNDLANKPPLTPPGWVFPVAWSILYALMAIGLARVLLRGLPVEKKDALLSFGLQLFFNLVWSVIFFCFAAYGVAFIWLAVLWLLILRMTLSFASVDPLAAWLQAPYLLWVLFAGYLNYGVWLLNR
jgi:tryptophan-rich sensory protein